MIGLHVLLSQLKMIKSTQLLKAALIFIYCQKTLLFLQDIL